jgi:photosynthetic reaction center cytochrome c subunit
MMRGFRFRSLVLPLAALAVLAGCERPPIESVQGGYRGTGMQQVYNQRLLVTQASLNTAPEPLAAASADGPKAKDVYQNVKVLGELSVGEFARNMVAITQWVAPKEGCTYCHNAANFADDAKYTKVVARRMLQMTQTVNADWKSHVGATGVTCYTCHRGNPVPNQVWFAPADKRSTGALLGDLEGQNQPAASVAYSSLPYDPFSHYLQDAKQIRVNGNEALAMTGDAANRSSTKQAEFTYGLMMHMSQSLGVNCTYCHNTQSFQSWEVSPPTRSTAWYGIRMARDLNNDYMTPLTATFPANRLGPKGDVAKVACGTCHQGAFKPLYGAEMAKHHRELLGPLPVTVAAAGAAGAAPTASATSDAGAASGAGTPAAAVTSAAPAATAPAAGATGDNKAVGAGN